MFCARDLTTLPTEEVDVQCTQLYLNENKFESLSSLEICPNLHLVIADDNSLTENLSLPYLPELHTLSLNKNHIKSVGPLCDELAVRAPKLTFLSLLGNPCSSDNIYQRLHHLRQQQLQQNQAESYFDGGSVMTATYPSNSPDVFASLTENPPLMAQQASKLTAVDNSNSLTLDENDNQLYRLRVIYRLPNLQFLDSSPVTVEERQQAKRQGPYLDVAVRRRTTGGTATTSPLTEWSRKRVTDVSDWMPKPLRDLLPSQPGDGDTGGNKKSEEAAQPVDDNQAAETASEADENQDAVLPSDLTPLPPSKNPTLSAPKAALGKCRYTYYGKHSEGNRFITNCDL